MYRTAFFDCWRHWCRRVGVAAIALLLAACGGTTAGATSVPIIGDTPGPATATPGPATNPTATATSTPNDPWAALAARPLQLPTVAAGATCPVTQGQMVSGAGGSPVYGKGPAYILVGVMNGTLHYDAAPALDSGSPWGLTQIRLVVGPTFTGPLLMRGGQLDGAQPLGFNGGEEFTPSNASGTEPVVSALRLSVTQPGSNQWYRATSYLRVRAPGCYAVQFDGASFSNVVVFQATSAS